MIFETTILNIERCQLFLKKLSKAIKNPIEFYKTKKKYLQCIEKDVTLYKEQEKYLADLILKFTNKCKKNNKNIYLTEEYTIHDKINYIDTSEYL